ncbi:uncharacterized protein CYBJADRAFT_167104 [Cyberlindnera jadinii NRRL Y-1542]|uniref:Uncharacterized protein n=1 Tax=Cyberlindnera jadinii (strain ATCC 18201 / CBS 1600 / BCRC 20928 / JCM 3617 / NBRC 0987 / NRRL Y-1542) TaxID=983966 RepID=A0A1E4S4L6_CYBJN|nr:hypothetical protein CYBJADRAFT_167104 [Cyberlindnera jadinii NRRL Y-1542]ODV74435.1 hypothetical protein CYBJADRAFT_167104 [Cyberlindnera jadinii NRRL Y-1542]
MGGGGSPSEEIRKVLKEQVHTFLYTSQYSEERTVHQWFPKSSLYTAAERPHLRRLIATGSSMRCLKHRLSTY